MRFWHLLIFLATKVQASLHKSADLLKHPMLTYNGADVDEGSDKASSSFDTSALAFNPCKPSVLFVGHMRTAQTQIRRRETWRLIRVSNVCFQNDLLEYE